jgi:hypothetical protein
MHHEIATLRGGRPLYIVSSPIVEIIGRRTSYGNETEVRRYRTTGSC